MLKQSNFFTRNTDITWKRFIRETCDVPTTSPEKKEYSLTFQGNEARKAYEQIISEASNANSQPEHKYRKPRGCVTRNQLRTQISTTAQSKDNQVSKEKVTVNAILKAVEQNDLNFLSKHVTQENVNSTDDYGWTPLMSAAYCGHMDIIKLLLNLGANRKAREKSGLTAAQLALKKNYLNIVALLKKKSEFATRKPLVDAVEEETSVDNVLELTLKSDSMKQANKQSEHVLKNNNNTRTSFDNFDRTGFYCEICNANFYCTTWKKHETSTLHIFNSKPKLPNAMYGISKQNKGYQMLLNHGWDEQNGLGPFGKGMKYPIKTRLKSDRKGLRETNGKEYRVTHFKFEDVTAINEPNASRPKYLKKRDRERLLNKEAKKEKALRLALS